MMGISKPKHPNNQNMPKWVWFIYVLAVLVVSVRNLSLPWGDLFADGGYYSHYNNYIIFKQSFFHLLDLKNLYIHYPQEQYDLFKYPPTFALLFAPFSVLPDFAGYTLWTALNLLLPLIAIQRLQGVSNWGKVGFAIVLLLEAITSALNSQSNGLMLGLLLLAFVSLQHQETTKAVIFIALTAYIKLFGILFFALFLLFPNALKQSIWRIPLVMGMLFLLPLPILGSGLLRQYQAMFNLLAHDHGFFVKYSVMGWLKQWFALQPNKNLVLILGLIIQALPLLYFAVRFTLWRPKSLIDLSPSVLSKFQFLYAGSWLIWMVIFNHMAESATYVIAVGGAALIFTQLFFSEHQPPNFETSAGFHRIRNVRKSHVLWLFCLTSMLLFTVLGPTDVYPKALRFWIVERAQLKAFPCILIWFMTTVELVGSLTSTQS